MRTCIQRQQVHLSLEPVTRYLSFILSNNRCGVTQQLNLRRHHAINKFLSCGSCCGLLLSICLDCIALLLFSGYTINDLLDLFSGNCNLFTAGSVSLQSALEQLDTSKEVCGAPRVAGCRWSEGLGFVESSPQTAAEGSRSSPVHAGVHSPFRSCHSPRCSESHPRRRPTLSA